MNTSHITGTKMSYNGTALWWQLSLDWCWRNYIHSYSPLFHASLSTLFLLLVTKMLAYSMHICTYYGVMTSNHPFSLVEKAYHADAKRAALLAYSAHPRFVRKMINAIFTVTPCYHKLSKHEEVKWIHDIWKRFIERIHVRDYANAIMMMMVRMIGTTLMIFSSP